MYTTVREEACTRVMPSYRALEINFESHFSSRKSRTSPSRRTDQWCTIPLLEQQQHSSLPASVPTYIPSLF